MTALLTLKEKIKEIYAEYHMIIRCIIRGLITFFMAIAINDKIGYMVQLNSIMVVLAISMIGAVLPGTFIIFVGFFMIMAHMYALSVEIMLVTLAVFAVMFFLYLRYCNKDLLVVVLTPLSFYIGIPYVMPLVVGILGGPGTALTVACGVLIHYFIEYISVNALMIQGMNGAGTIDRIRVGLDGIIHNEDMLLAIVSFTITTLVVYILRRQAIDHAWNVAICSGAMIHVIINFMGILILECGPSVFHLLIGTVVSIPLALLIGFLFIGVDYSRTERVQFEDENYYYYVKAVPKMNIQAPARTVKKINTKRNHTYKNRE